MDEGEKREAMTRILILLQNAWSPLYAGGVWPRESWLRALDRSRSGQRLRVIRQHLQSNAIILHADNTTPIVGVKSSSVVQPDPGHIETLLRSLQPHGVVAMGKQAEKSMFLSTWTGPLLVTPHPAYRMMTNELLALIAFWCWNDDRGSGKLIQRKGYIEQRGF